MKKISLTLFLLLIGSLNAFAQTPGNTTPGPVWRVVYYRVLPGKMNETQMDMRKHLRFVYDEAKKQGVIVDYKLFTNSTQTDPEEWNLALAFAFKNWSALDDYDAKMAPILLKHYGSEEKREAAVAYRRQLFQTVASKLMREVTLNPLP